MNIGKKKYSAVCNFLIDFRKDWECRIDINTMTSNLLSPTLREKCSNTEFFMVRVFPHSENLCIQSECRKIRIRKNSVF